VPSTSAFELVHSQPRRLPLWHSRAVILFSSRAVQETMVPRYRHSVQRRSLPIRLWNPTQRPFGSISTGRCRRGRRSSQVSLRDRRDPCFRSPNGKPRPRGHPTPVPGRPDSREQAPVSRLRRGQRRANRPDSRQAVSSRQGPYPQLEDRKEDRLHSSLVGTNFAFGGRAPTPMAP